jgi:hypothetical protein
MLWVAGSSPAGGANTQVNAKLTKHTRTGTGRGTFYGPQTPQRASCWAVWDNREIVSRHSTGLDAHKAILGSRHVSPDSGRKLWLYDPMGRVVAAYVDGREQLDELSGPAFPGLSGGTPR